MAAKKDGSMASSKGPLPKGGVSPKGLVSAKKGLAPKKAKKKDLPSGADKKGGPRAPVVADKDVRSDSDREKAELMEMHDPEGEADLSNPPDVLALLESMFKRTWGHKAEFHWEISRAHAKLVSMYCGVDRDYMACDAKYHDLKHAMDTAVCMARMMERSTVSGSFPISPEGAAAAIVTAMFHDIGYIRKKTEVHLKSGAELIRTHVYRGEEFMAGWLAGGSLEKRMDGCKKMLLATEMSVPFHKIDFNSKEDRVLSMMMGTADVLSQMSDRAYLEKCRDFLYEELETAGLAGAKASAVANVPVFTSREDLLGKTAAFYDTVIRPRMETTFERSFDSLLLPSGNKYMEVVESNIAHIRELSKTRSFEKLRRKPVSLSEMVASLASR